MRENLLFRLAQNSKICWDQVGVGCMRGGPRICGAWLFQVDICQTNWNLRKKNFRNTHAASTPKNWRRANFFDEKLFLAHSS